jgi:hypothetical protein
MALYSFFDPDRHTFPILWIHDVLLWFLATSTDAHSCYGSTPPMYVNLLLLYDVVGLLVVRDPDACTPPTRFINSSVSIVIGNRPSFVITKLECFLLPCGLVIGFVVNPFTSHRWLVATS